VPGFWDGGEVYKIRFSPPTTGEWRYETRSATPELKGKTGAFTVTAAFGKNHGPVEVFDTSTSATPTARRITSSARPATPGPISRKLQRTDAQDAGRFALQQDPLLRVPQELCLQQERAGAVCLPKGRRQVRLRRPDPAFWRHFEQRILDLQKLGIEADLILWHPYDRWGFADMSDTEDDRYLRYCIARLSAFRNVWWSLANEYDFMTDRPPATAGTSNGRTGTGSSRFSKRKIRYQRLRGIHNGSLVRPHQSLGHARQPSDLRHERRSRFREQYRKPVVYDECKYEGNIPQGWGNLTARK
jgi:hypothetical protein